MNSSTRILRPRPANPVQTASTSIQKVTTRKRPLEEQATDPRRKRSRKHDWRPPLVPHPKGKKRPRDTLDSIHNNSAAASRKQAAPRNTLSQVIGAKRKRSQDSEAEAEGLEGSRPAKGQRLPCQYALSEKNLSILNEQMNFAPTLKRSSSRRSMAPSESETVRSQRSSSTTAVYRHKNLAAFEIHFHAEPPDSIRAAIDRIINTSVSEERRAEIHVIARQLRSRCLANVRAQSGEDDFVRPLHHALEALGLKDLCIHQKAEWREELKPVIPQDSHFSSSFMAGVEELEVADASVPPRKRQQKSTGKTYMSPESLRANEPANDLQGSSVIPPPQVVPEKEGDGPTIKVPRPDISIGIQLPALISALSSQNLNNVKARQFLTWLQDEMVEQKPDGPLEPMLILVPAPRALDLAFPFAVVEGKAYSTGKQIFEAENQAAVAGACALKIQLDLDDLVEHAAKTSGARPTSSNTEPPLFFTICTQGPIHELWAHWTVVEDYVRMFDSKLLDSCNALLLDRGEEFMVKLNNVGVWGTGPFMKSVVERLGKVARQART